MKKLFFLILTLSCGCGRHEAGDIGVIDLLSPPAGEITLLSDIATDVEYIPLQTSENFLIRYINYFKTSDNKFYINTLIDIICFDKTGRYLYKLDKRGRGPGEYTFISQFDINSDFDLLVILISKKILIFKETENGFVFSKSLNLWDEASYIDSIPGQNNILLSCYSPYGNELFRNVLINLEGDTLNVRPNYYKYKKIGNAMFASTYYIIRFKYNNILHFKELLSDTVFALDQFNNIRPYLILDSHGKKVTPEALVNVDYYFEHKSDYLIINKIIEVSKYFIYEFSYEKSSYCIFYDKFSNKKYEVNTKTFLNDDITGGVNFEPKFCSDGKLYFWVDALTLEKHVSGDAFKNSVVKDSEKKKALEKLADSLNETDNPVLIVVTPKN